MKNQSQADIKTSNRFSAPAGHAFAALLFAAFVCCFSIGLMTTGFPTKFLMEYRNTVPPGTPVMDRIESAIGIFDKVIIDSVPQHDNFIELYGEAQVIMGKKTIPDPNYGYLYKTSDGQITYLINQRDLKECSAKIAALDTGLKEYGINNFFWVLAPFKLIDERTVRPITLDYGDENSDAFLADLERSGVDTLDLRGTFRDLEAGGIPQSQLFYNTDHHWTIPSALKATGIIAEKLNSDYGMNIDLTTFDPENYTFQNMKRSYIGSMGRRVGVRYGGIDDFMLVLPDFKTDLTLKQTDYGATVRSDGSFYDAVIVKDYIENPDLKTNRYAAYHGDNEELIFINHLVKQGKILIIKDSFGVPVYSFLSLGVHEVRALDPRLYKGSILEYAKAYKPDAVFFIFNADSLNINMFQWTL